MSDHEMRLEAPTTAACPYCAGRHLGKCHLVQAIEYYENGSLRRVEFYSPEEVIAATTIAIRSNGKNKEAEE